MPTPPEDRTLTAEAPAAIACDHCGQMIGVYEPLVMVDHGEVSETSRALVYRLPLRARYYHPACYQAL